MILLAEYAVDARGHGPDWKPDIAWLETGDEKFPWKTYVPGCVDPDPLLARRKEDIVVEVQRRMQGDIALVSLYRK